MLVQILKHLNTSNFVSFDNLEELLKSSNISLLKTQIEEMKQQLDMVNSEWHELQEKLNSKQINESSINEVRASIDPQTE